ncbi:MAG: ATP-binding protein, partial [Candidatus Eisenbacteria bacterium]
LPPGMEERARKITEAMGLLEGLRVERRAAVRSYVLPFALAYIVLLSVAVLVGAALAGRIARPIEDLVASTRRVAGGDLDERVPLTGQGETRDLQVSFNEMVERLASQRKELARLERKAAWRDLARALAHEIKNPLTPIQLAVQEMRDRFRGDDREYGGLLREAGAIVDEEIENLRALVREFSEFARLPEPKPREADLMETLGEIVRLYGEEKAAVEAPGGPVVLRFDPEEIRRALINLADNAHAACRAAGRPEKVLFRVAPGRGVVRIEVIDEGCGIPPENVERIFEPDFTTKKGGMGLGLAIVEGIVSAHRGAIDVRSETGRGTTFTVALPLLGAK